MAKHVIHAHSVKTDNGNPKLPHLDRIEYGEIAINYASGAETIFLKNTNNEFVLVKTDDYYQKKFDDTNKNIEDNELVTSTALNNLNERINNIPNEVLIGDVITGTPSIFIDTSETKELEIYTREQIDGIISSLETDIEASTAITQQISEKINSLDSNAKSNDGEFISVEISQIDGKINSVSVDDASIKDINTAINKVKTDLNAFLSSAEIGDEAIDTLKEIQSYINNDSGATIEILKNISKAQTTGENAQTSADNAHKNIEAINSIIGKGFDSSSTISDQFYTLQTNIENNELVTSTALNNLNTRINYIPYEVFIGGESSNNNGNILIDTTENVNVEVYTKSQVDAIIAALEARIRALEN